MSEVLKITKGSKRRPSATLFVSLTPSGGVDVTVWVDTDTASCEEEFHISREQLLGLVTSADRDARTVREFVAALAAEGGA